MKAKHIAFLSLSVLAGTFASCTGSHEIKITGSAKKFRRRHNYLSEIHQRNV